MSYATHSHGLGGTLAEEIDVAASMAKAQARARAETMGVPTNVFDMYDQACSIGVATMQDNNRSPQAFLSANAKLIADNVGAPALAQATGLDVGSVSKVLGWAQGEKVTVGDACSVVGAVAGVAICGPPCAPLGSLIGAVVGSAISTVISGIADLFGSSSAKRREYEQALRREIGVIQESLYDDTIEVMVAVQFAVAQTYNRVLELGIPVPNTIADVAAALAKYHGDREAYKNDHDGKQPEQTVIIESRTAFSHQVATLVNTNYSGMWDQGMQESGWTDNVLRWAFRAPQQIPTTLYKNSNTGKSVWCGWQDVAPQCADSGAPLGSLALGLAPAQKSAAEKQADLLKQCTTLETKLSLWQCHNSPDPGRYRQYFFDSIKNFYGSNWTSIAARDAALWRLRVQKRQQEAQIASAAAAAVAAAIAAARAKTNQALGEQEIAKIQAAAAAAQQAKINQQLVAQQLQVRAKALAEAQARSFAQAGLSVQAAAIGIGLIGLAAAAALFVFLEDPVS